MTTRKTIALTRWTFFGKVKSLVFNILSAAAAKLQTDILRLSFNILLLQNCNLFYLNVSFCRLDHIRSKTKSYKLKKIEVIRNIFSNNNVMKLKISSKGKTGKFTNVQILNDILLNNHCAKEEIEKEIRR